MKHLQLDDLQEGDRLALTPPWRHLRYAVLEAGAVFAPPVAEPCEEGYLLLEGRLAAGLGGTVGPAALLRRGVGARVTHGGGGPARLLYMGVDAVAASTGGDDWLIEAVDLDRLTWRAAIHGGAGRMATRHIWGPDDFNSTWTFYDHAVLAAHSSVGYHYHDALEECFIVLAGQGYMTIDDETFAVGPGSVTFQGIGQGHGMYNPYPQDLNFVRLAVAQPDQTYTTIDLHDDLAARRP
ncbi:MAG: cupin domain-containing protein [Candidatus Latescibacteria bacterium]|nr:cupin domain-containing protein [Candidatus Latescibacterota bacterium]